MNMNKVLTLSSFLLLFFSSLSLANVQSQQLPPNAYLTDDERAKVVRQLLDSQKEYLDAIETLSDQQWKYKPSPFKWSVGQAAEHIMLTEPALFSAVEGALALPVNPDWEKKTAGKAQFIEQVMPVRRGRAQAPREVQPSGKLTKAEVLRRFKEQRARTLEFAQNTKRPLKAHTLDHPFPAFGTLSAYDWLIYIPLHNIRHNKQIAEVKADPGFPK